MHTKMRLRVLAALLVPITLLTVALGFILLPEQSFGGKRKTEPGRRIKKLKSDIQENILTTIQEKNDLTEYLKSL